MDMKAGFKMTVRHTDSSFTIENLTIEKRSSNVSVALSAEACRTRGLLPCALLAQEFRMGDSGRWVS